MTESSLPKRAGAAGRNWALWLGGIFTLLVIILAVIGPLLSPHDPLQENYVAKVGDRFIRPPFPPGTEGFALGTDDFGRDILSRLLWAMRPTFTLVVVVAALRMAAGILIGLLAGWSVSRASQSLDTIISAAMAVPVLFVALCVVAALARRWGVWAFIIGLSITGWAEAARVVQEQTRAIKSQPFIEAARAMGGTDGQITVSHVIPHILPLMWIQVAFEISGALLTTAALGFLGYYVNAVWIPIEDFIGLRASGLPELSEMLGASIQQQPWTAVFAGTLVFFIVLAFNLLGEGLRLQCSPERHRRNASGPLQDKTSSWLEERLYRIVSRWRRTATTSGAFAFLAIVLAGGGWFLWHAQNSKIAASPITLPGGHSWVSELRDAQGTLWTTTRGPVDEQIVWTFTAPDRLTGGPVVDREGRLFLTGRGGLLYRLGSDGALLGSTVLPAEPVGSPALHADGSLIVADSEAGLSAYQADGTRIWNYRSDPSDKGRASPIVRSDGMSYIVTQNYIVAVDAAGERAWQILLPTYSFTSPLARLSLQEEYLIFEDTIVDASSGQRFFAQTGEPLDRYLVGADGSMYYNSTSSFFDWQPTEKGAVMTPVINLDERLLLTRYRIPFLVGVSPSQQAWLLYSSGFEYMRLVWVAQKGESLQISDFPYRTGRLIGIDSDGTAYVCGFPGTRVQLECRAVRIDSGMLLWKTVLDTKAAPVGGALLEGRLYVAIEDGKLFAIGR